MRWVASVTVAKNDMEAVHRVVHVGFDVELRQVAVHSSEWLPTVQVPRNGGPGDYCDRTLVDPASRPKDCANRTATTLSGLVSLVSMSRQAPRRARHLVADEVDTKHADLHT